MELIPILKLPVEAAQFIGRQLLGGGWSELPALPQVEPVQRPVRAAIHYFSTAEKPGQE